jgi:hypothetical protein
MIFPELFLIVSAREPSSIVFTRVFVVVLKISSSQPVQAVDTTSYSFTSPSDDCRRLAGGNPV